jgi:hypothetical protein
MAIARYPARYQDAYGEEETVIENDGKVLHVEIRAVTFQGTDFDMFEPLSCSAT